MEKIYQHIEKLFGLNEYVVVPGLGGFVLQQQPAAIIDNKLIAPRKVISFNALMHHPDGLLVIEIARTEHISYRIAQELLQHELAIFKQELQISGRSTFGNLGTFHLSGEGIISFEPNPQAPFIPSNIGLSDLQLTDYSAPKIQLIPKNRKLRAANSIMRYAAVFALLLSTLFSPDYRNRNSDSQSAAIVSLSNLISVAKIEMQHDSITVADTAKHQVYKKAETAIGTMSYHVIVASMPTKQMAENYCNVIKQLDYAETKVLEPSKTYRVAIKSFTDREEAVKYMEKLRTTDERFSTAWVLCKN